MKFPLLLQLPISYQVPALVFLVFPLSHQVIIALIMLRKGLIDTISVLKYSVPFLSSRSWLYFELCDVRI